MPIATRKAAPATRLQTFRAITEGYLLQVAQREMVEMYGIGVPPVPKHGWIYRVLLWAFLPGFRLTPWPIRRWLLTRFFVHAPQRWPQPPWEQPCE